MKTSLWLAAACAVFATTPAMADNTSFAGFNPYVGVDLQRTSYDLSEEDGLDYSRILEDNLNGFNIHAGVRPHPNFGAELGFFRNAEEGRDIPAGTLVGPGSVAATNISTDVNSYGFTLDALGYLPLSKQVDLIGTAGVTWTEMEIALRANGVEDKEDESELGLRGGAGAQFKFTDDFSARGLMRYQTADFDGGADGAWTASLGLNYAL